MKNPKALLIPLLIGITIFSIINFFLTQKEKGDLVNLLNNLNVQVGALENEKRYLLENIQRDKQLQKAMEEENVGLKSILNTTQEQLTKLDSQFQEAQKKTEQLSLDMSNLQTENEALRTQKDILAAQIISLAQQKNTLQGKFNSLTELKKAISELKQQMRQARLSKKKIEVKLKKKENTDILGNCGFLIREGKSTYPARVKIEVVPVP